MGYYYRMSDRIIFHDHITELYYGIILRNYITGSYYGIILRDHITESYYGLIFTKRIQGMPGTSPEPPEIPGIPWARP